VQNLYIESKEITHMTEAEVAEFQAELGGVMVRGKNAMRPIRSWPQCGLSLALLHALQRHGYREPLPIQTQAMPNIMAGRDCIGVATTGSGKTLAFVLPMLRHIGDQVCRGLDEKLGNGPVGLIIAPTRELVQQARLALGSCCFPHMGFVQSAGLQAFKCCFRSLADYFCWLGRFFPGLLFSC
jgi:ATP-dependent RNA helicase DDX46/PRP5